MAPLPSRRGRVAVRQPAGAGRCALRPAGRSARARGARGRRLARAGIHSRRRPAVPDGAAPARGGRAPRRDLRRPGRSPWIARPGSRATRPRRGATGSNCARSERVALEAYADGVNAFLADHALPLELRALHLTPSPGRRSTRSRSDDCMQDDLSVAGVDRARRVRRRARRGTRRGDRAPRRLRARSLARRARDRRICSPAPVGRRASRRRRSRRPRRGATHGRSRGRAPRRASPSWRATRTWPRSVPASGTRRT